ncbi:allantoinase AllB [Paenibacillus bovis]|uniref:Allantoinase n=1 Tax=Paenibacillus bovis TaxID=1616788 RepID=A0A172ZH32_9BACL|nr:allantoinase AllB [Paenibacillus bovis]ANF96450.1 allantoinase [Paenibacillus bovis]
MQPNTWNCIIKGGLVVLPDRIEQLDIVIQEGRIQSLMPYQTASEELPLPVIDAAGLHVLPGAIDIHVHFNEPGLGAWEGFETGSAALAAGGITTYVDMPLNGVPPTVKPEYLILKKQAAEGRSYVDYALWGGLVEGNIDQLEGLAAGGAAGFKAFMSEPGGEGEEIFTRADDQTLLEGMKEIARLGGVLAVHAEDEQLVSVLAAEARQQGRMDAIDYIHSRPVEAEMLAVQQALSYARESGCALHFVHISSREAVDIIIAAKKEGLDVTVETCPHYLVLTEESMLTQGSIVKCAPPLRSRQQQEQLWEAVREGLIDIIASDHSPCPPAMKQSDDFFAVWGGISGGQSTLLLMLEQGYHQRGIPLPQLMQMLADQPAERLGLSHIKGKIAEGMDADLVLVNLTEPYELTYEELYDRHKQNPYTGFTFSSTIVRTLVRGNTVYQSEQGLVSQPVGRFIARQPGGVVHG